MILAVTATVCHSRRLEKAVPGGKVSRGLEPVWGGSTGSTLSCSRSQLAVDKCCCTLRLWLVAESFLIPHQAQRRKPRPSTLHHMTFSTPKGLGTLVNPANERLTRRHAHEHAHRAGNGDVILSKVTHLHGGEPLTRAQQALCFCCRFRSVLLVRVHFLLLRPTPIQQWTQQQSSSPCCHLKQRRPGQLGCSTAEQARQPGCSSKDTSSGSSAVLPDASSTAASATAIAATLAGCTSEARGGLEQQQSQQQPIPRMLTWLNLRSNLGPQGINSWKLPS